MAVWRKCLALLLCSQLLVVSGWGQPADPALNYLSEGIAAYQRGDWQASAGALERALAQGFGNPLYRLDALVVLGRAYARMGRRERAQAYFRQVLELQPDYRLDSSDEAGLALFEALLAGTTPQTQRKGGFPKGKVALAVLAVSAAAIAFLLLGPSSGGAAEGTVEGDVVLP
jgi:tetratricopeptide (TPR) repeat protein